MGTGEPNKTDSAETQRGDGSEEQSRFKPLTHKQAGLISVQIALLAVASLTIFQNCEVVKPTDDGQSQSQTMPQSITQVSDSYKAFSEIDSATTQQSFSINLQTMTATISVQNPNQPLCQDSFLVTSDEIAQLAVAMATTDICGGPGSPPRPEPAIACVGGCPQHQVIFYSPDFTNGQEEVDMSVVSPEESYYFCGDNGQALMTELSTIVQQNSKCTSTLLW